jgi:hypothetical protein
MMNNRQRGSSMANGSALNGGNSFANGPDMPKWASHWEFILLRDTLVTSWSVQP